MGTQVPVGFDAGLLDSTARTGILRIWETGNRLEVNRPNRDDYQGLVSGGGQRSKVTEFSRNSRRRLARKINSTDRREKFIFVTLTYPENMTDGRQGKKHLKAFLQRLRYHRPDISGFWKLEFQHRGAIHFHLMLFTRWLDAREVFGWWGRIIGDKSTFEDSASTEVRAPRVRESARRYLFAYLGKADYQTDASHCAEVGRFWGVVGTDSIPYSTVKTIYAGGQFCTHFCTVWADELDLPFTPMTFTIFISDDQAIHVRELIEGFEDIPYDYGSLPTSLQ